MSALNPLGRRFSFAEACAFLDWPASRLRQWVTTGKVAHVKTSQTARTRRVGGKTIAYTKTGRVEFYERDLLAVIDELRVPAKTVTAPAPRAARRQVDDEVASLIGPQDEVFR